MIRGIIAVMAMGCLLLPSTGEAFKAKVLRVVNGDSIIVKRQGKQMPVRLMCVECPELTAPGGQESARFLKELIADGGDTLRVEPHGTDQEGRTLAWVYHPGYANLSWQVVRLGHGRWLSKDCPNEGTMKELEKGAREAGIGIWKK